MGPQYIALVDWIFGPHWVSFEQYFYGNWDNVPIIFFFDVLSRLIPSYILQYIFIALLFVLGVASMWFCLRRFTTIGWIQLIGSVLFVLTPWVYDRLFFGQVWVVAAYMFLPVVVGLAWDLISRKLDLRFVISLIFSLFFLGMLNARFFPIGLLVIALFFAHRLWRDRSWNVVYYGLITFIGSVILSLYWIVPLLGSDVLGSLGDVAQIVFFSPTGSVGQLFLDTLSLNNSWMNYRTRALIPIDTVSWLPIVFAVLYAGLTTFGFFFWSYRGKYILLALGLFSALFSLNMALPVLGDINLWIIEHIPGFSAYREPGKWLGLLAIFYVISIVILLSRALHHWTRWLVLTLTTLLLGSSVYIFTVLPWQKDWTIQYPADWYEIKEYHAAVLDSDRTIVFPWHWYLGCDFSDRRIMQNPAKTFFGPNIIYGDNMEGGGVYSYSTKPLSVDLEKVLSRRDIPINIDDLLAVLRYHGIEHIVYFPTCASAPRYDGLLNVTDVIYRSDSIYLLRVPEL